MLWRRLIAAVASPSARHAQRIGSRAGDPGDACSSAAAVPAIFLAAQVAVRKLGHIPMPGPVDESIFIAMTGPVSLLLPLALLSMTLAGHGFRERLAYYLFAAGLLANASSAGGYFLAFQDKLGEPWVDVHALLLAAGVAWLWTIAWTWFASLLENEEDRPLLDSPLCCASTTS